LAIGTLMLLQMASAKGRLDLPEKIFTAVNIFVARNRWVRPLSNGQTRGPPEKKQEFEKN
jgi:hypothetical protein